MAVLAMMKMTMTIVAGRGARLHYRDVYVTVSDGNSPQVQHVMA